MKQAQSNICVDDCVRDNGGVQGPDFGGDIGGWQGRISSIDPSEDQVLVLMQSDSITLKQMPVAIVEQREGQGLDTV